MILDTRGPARIERLERDYGPPRHGNRDLSGMQTHGMHRRQEPAPMEGLLRVMDKPHDVHAVRGLAKIEARAVDADERRPQACARQGQPRQIDAHGAQRHGRPRPAHDRDSPEHDPRPPTDPRRHRAHAYRRAQVARQGRLERRLSGLQERGKPQRAGSERYDEHRKQRTRGCQGITRTAASVAPEDICPPPEPYHEITNPDFPSRASSVHRHPRLKSGRPRTPLDCRAARPGDEWACR